MVLTFYMKNQALDGVFIAYTAIKCIASEH